MAVKYRWYRIRLVRKEQDLGKLLARRPLAEGADFGFYRAESQKGEESFRFVWRTTVTTTRVLDDGEAAVEQFQSFDVIGFSILSVGRLLLMRVENPNRNSRDLMNAIEGIAGFGFSCAAVTFEHARPVLLFDRIDESRLVGLKLAGAVIGEDLVARMEFVSRRGIDLEKMKILRGLQYKLDVAVFDCSFRGLKGQVSISSGGLVRLSGPLTPHLRELIQKELPNIVRADR